MEMIRREIFTVKRYVKNSPHTARVVSSTEWVYNYTREQAAYPVDQKNKFWNCSCKNRQCLWGS